MFRELCWLGGLTISLSVVYAISVRSSGESALGETLAVAATCAIAVGGALTTPSLVRSALRLPTATDLLLTLLTAIATASALTVAFWLLGILGFPLLTGYLDAYTNDDWPVWAGYVNIALVTPIAEELLFRGVFQPKLGQLIQVKDALIVQAALFSAMHLSPVILVTHFIMGLSLGFVRLRSGSLIPGILLHAAWNAWVVWSSG